jgi:hypothetical protein
VIAQAVGLDHQAEFGPVEVDLEAVDPFAGSRLAESGGPHDRQELALEIGRCEDEGVAVEQLAYLHDSATPRVALDRRP